MKRLALLFGHGMLDKNYRELFVKILLAPDSFKGSLSQVGACDAMRQAVKQAVAGGEVIDFPLSDGGDGFASVLAYHCHGRKCAVSVQGPSGSEVEAEYLVLDQGEVVIEVASACGLHLLKNQELNPLAASSYGVGQLIRAAIEAGHRKLIIGLGGSATNDGGAGLLSALGYRLLDEYGEDISSGAEGLSKLQRIDTEHVLPGLSDTRIVLASDVQNPLLGKEGASRTFGPQKGATPEMVEALETALAHFDRVTKASTGLSMADEKGAGAAGGIGAALMAFASARYRAGFEVIVELTGLRNLLLDVQPDLIITSEGCLDQQTWNGKLPLGVSRLAAECKIPVAVIAGQIKLSDADIKAMGFTYADALCNETVGVEEATLNASRHLQAATRRVMSKFLQHSDRRV